MDSMTVYGEKRAFRYVSEKCVSFILWVAKMAKELLAIWLYFLSLLGMSG